MPTLPPFHCIQELGVQLRFQLYPEMQCGIRARGKRVEGAWSRRRERSQGGLLWAHRLKNQTLTCLSRSGLSNVA